MVWNPYSFSADRDLNISEMAAKVSSHFDQLGANSSTVHASQTVDFTVDAPGIWPVDATAGAVVVTLSDAADSAGWAVTVIKTDASVNTVTVNRAGTDTLEGGTTGDVLSTQRARKRFTPVDTDWYFDL